MLPPLKTPKDMAALGVAGVILLQPTSNLPYLPNPQLSDMQLGAIPDMTNAMLFYEQTPYADGGRCVAFLDGHVARVTAEEWAALKAKAGMK
jgi:prepilin-type processing-associated H-X9-DG protein